MLKNRLTMVLKAVYLSREFDLFRYLSKVQKFAQNVTHLILIASGLASEVGFPTFVIIQIKIERVNYGFTKS